MNPEKGLICKLTGDAAAFEDDCEDFTGDRNQIPFIRKRVTGAEGNDDVPVENFPPKPVEKINTQTIRKSSLTLLLFIGAFYFLFNWKIEEILIITAVVFIHELGHYFAMKIFNYKDLSIFFMPLIGAFTAGEKDTVSQKQSIIILLAGPLPGIILGTILYYFGLRDGNELYQNVAGMFIIINLFNLLPVMPLDGGRLLKLLFFEKNEVLNEIFLFLSVALLTLVFFYLKSYFLLIIPGFLLFQFKVLSQLKKLKVIIKNKGIDLDKSYSELSDSDYWLIRDELGRQIRVYQHMITPGWYVESDNENKVIRQVKSLLEKRPEMDVGWLGKIAVIFVWFLSFTGPFISVSIFYLN